MSEKFFLFCRLRKGKITVPYIFFSFLFVLYNLCMFLFFITGAKKQEQTYDDGLFYKEEEKKTKEKRLFSQY